MMTARLLTVLLVVVLLVGGSAPPTMVRAQQEAPTLDGVTLSQTTVAGLPIFFDPDIEPMVVATAGEALANGLVDVPTLSGLPPFSTPIEVYLLADEEQFRRALAEIGQVRVDLVADEIGGYTIERNGTMLVFFAAANVADPANATLGFAHELAHLAVREATQRRTVPQWFNEGYATWISGQAQSQRYPDEARLQRALDRATVASALATRGLIPWPELVTRTRFSRAGVEGLVGLAYAQSTLFMDWLATQHGLPALAQFLTGIGGGLSPTQAFAAAFGLFGPESEAYEASLGALQQEYPPGLYVLQRATPDRPLVLALVGGGPSETAVVELITDGELTRRREIDLDGAGLLVASIPASLLDPTASLRVRVAEPVLGVLEIDPIADTSAPSSAPTRQRTILAPAA
jgi:hypothetical protein